MNASYVEDFRNAIVLKTFEEYYRAAVQQYLPGGSPNRNFTGNSRTP